MKMSLIGERLRLNEASDVQCHRPSTVIASVYVNVLIAARNHQNVDKEAEEKKKMSSIFACFLSKHCQMRKVLLKLRSFSCVLSFLRWKRDSLLRKKKEPKVNPPHELQK